MSTHTPDSPKRRVTPRQIARAVRRGTAIPANPRPRPPMPQPSSIPTRARTALSVEPVEEPVETEGAAEEEQEPPRRWGQALFLQQGIGSARTEGSGWMATLRDRLPRRSPYSWRERDWRSGAWARRARMLPVAAAVLVAMVVVGAFAFVIASRAANGAASRLHSVSSASTATPSSGGLILQQQPTGQPTPVAPTYTIGAWVTSYAPSAGGTEQVYVRVSQNDNPAKGVQVSLSVTWPGGASSYGPARTDAYGLASFKVSVSGPPGQPELVTATASVGGSPVSASTTFVPA